MISKAILGIFYLNDAVGRMHVEPKSKTMKVPPFFQNDFVASFYGGTNKHTVDNQNKLDEKQKKRNNNRVIRKKIYSK